MLLLLACTHRDLVNLETDVSKAVISDAQLDDLGKQLHADLLKSGVKLLDDPDVNAYVTDIATRIAKTVTRSAEVDHLKVYVIDDKKTVNAMATPGGYVYVYTGLLLAATDEAEVAGVVGHEIGHVAERHVARQMTLEYGASVLMDLALGKKPDQLAQIASQVASQGFFLANSRADESDADKLGLLYLSRAGWDVTALPRFFKVLMKKEGDTPDYAVWFSSHPSTESRVDDLNALIKEHGYSGGDKGEAEHAAILAKLEGR